MNSELHSNLAAQIKSNPHVFADMDDILLRESILQFHEGRLNETESAEVSALIQSNPYARSILDGILAAERYGKSENGKAWLDGLLERVIAETPVASARLNATLRARITDKAVNLIDSVQSLLSPGQTVLSCSTDTAPIYGKAGPNDEIMVTMRSTSSGHTEISLSTKIEAWTDLVVALGEHQPQKIQLERVGDRWAGSLVCPVSFAILKSTRPSISVKTS